MFLYIKKAFNNLIDKGLSKSIKQTELFTDQHLEAYFMQIQNLFPHAVGAAFIALVTVNMPLARAEPIAISNPSFESPTLSPGSFNIADITGWSVINTGNPGVFRPSSISFDSAFDGVQTLYSNGGTVFQTIPTALAPNTVYTLGVSVGRRRDFITFPGFTVELRAGGTVLASANQNNIRLPDPGKFERLTLTYVSPRTVSPGQLLEIRFKSNGAQTNFDFVTLDTRSFSP